MNSSQTVHSDDGALIGLTITATTATIAVETLTLTILWLLSLIGNSLVCVVVRRSRRIQSTTNYFIVSLAIFDLGLSLLCVPFVMARVVAGTWMAGHFFCKLVRFFQHALPSAVVLVLLSICVDRFYTIIYPLSFKVTRGTAKRMIVCSCVLASVLSVLCLYFFSVVELRYVGGFAERSSASSSSSVLLVCPTYVPATHWGGVTYIVVLVVCHFALPLLIMCGLYVRVAGHIWTAGTLGVRTIQRTRNPVPQTKVRMVKMLLMVTVSTLVMMTPFYVAQLVYCIEPSNVMDRKVFVFAFWFLEATGASKPLLYLYFNANFRRGCKEVLCMSAMRCYRSHIYTITTASVLGKKNYVGVVSVSGTHSASPHSLTDTSSAAAASHWPLQAFNRASQTQATSWPLHGSLPSSYV